MRHRGFAGRDAWLAAVERELAHPAALPILAAKGLDPDVVRTVARIEASHASPLGLCSLSAEQLAGATRLPRAAVLRARLALVELGLEDVVAGPATAGVVHRELHHE
ncbi:hypothetical protein [Leifsonia sp. NPDC077715]|uniref:hypothetical protein n=1 Tax=Leifsonia sp. NPDC077715 TaxID=3155539 RepID=UPI0034245291